jgi:Tfp pilus assembly protein PilN
MKAVNLVPTDERGGPSITAGRSGGAVYVALGLLGVLAVFALLYGLAAHQISSSRSQVASLTARTKLAQARAAQLAPYTSFVAMRGQRVQAVSQLVNSRFDWAHAFHELGRVLPSNVSLTSLNGTVGSASTPGAATSSTATATATASSTVTSATPPGSVPIFTIAGCATSQAEVALMLDRLRLIDGVSEVALQSSTKSDSVGGGGGGGGGGGASGGVGCEGGDPAYTVQVTFDALPSVSAASFPGSTTTVSTSVSGAASVPSAGAAR